MKRAPLIIAGSGRSGTTWILDSLAEANRAKTYFEPLNPNAVAQAKKFANQYVRKNADEPELREFFDKVFQGRIYNTWVNYRMRPEKLLPRKKNEKYEKDVIKNIKRYGKNYKKLIINYFKYNKISSKYTITKFIRANLMLGWIFKNYNAKIILVVRHPSSVISSRLKLTNYTYNQFWDYENLLLKYRDNIPLGEDYLNDFKKIFNKNLSATESLAVIWCIENMLPIKSAKIDGRPVVYYEDLLLRPEKTWKFIVSYFNLVNVPKQDIIVKPSQQAAKDFKSLNIVEKQLSKWKDYLSEKQILEIDNILKTFNVTTYNAYNPFPIK